MSRLRLAALALGLIAVIEPAAFGRALQDPPPAASEPGAQAELDAQAVALGQAALEAATDLSEEDRSRARADWVEALQLLGEQDLARKEAESLEAEAAAAPARLAELEASLAQTPPEPRVDVPEGATLKDVEHLREAAGRDAEAARQEVAALKSEEDRRSARLAELPEQLSQARDAVLKAREGLLASAPEAEPAALREARTAKLRARVQVAEARLRQFQAEQRAYQAGDEVLQDRRDLARRGAGIKEQLASAWEATASEYRRREASETHGESEVLAERVQAWPELSAVAAQNRAFAEELSDPKAGLNAKLDDLTRRRDEARRALAEMRDSFVAAQKRYGYAGGTFSIGELLRREFERLPDERAFRRSTKSWRKELVEAELRLFDLGILRDQVFDVGARVRQFLEKLPASLPPDERAQLETDARTLFATQRELLDDLRDSYRIYSATLEELEAADVQLADDVAEFRDFIAQRILWVRSVEAGKLFEPAEALQGFTWLIGVHAEAQGAQSLARIWRRQGGAVIAIGIGFALFSWLRRRAIARLGKVASRLVSYRTDSILHTFEAMLLTGVIASPVPLLLTSMGWIVGSIEEPTVWERAWAGGLRDLNWLAFAIFYLRAATRAGGLAEVHFRWPKPATAALRRDLLWLVPFAVTMHLVVWVMLSQGNEAWNNSLGRLAFVVAMGVFAIFSWRCFDPRRPVLKTFVERNPSSPMVRLRYLWPILGVGFPISHAIFACLGYYYSALNLERAVGDTLVFVAVTVILFNLGLRWLYVARRRLTVQEALRRREKALEEAGKEGANPELAVVVEDKIDIPAVDAQTRSLLRAGVVIALLLGIPKIWSEIVPSLHLFDRVQLWPHFALLEAEQSEDLLLSDAPAPKDAAKANGKDGGAGASNGAGLISGLLPPLGVPDEASSDAASSDPEDSADGGYSITLADLGMALVLAVLTALAMLNIPGLLEITLLKRLPVDAGSRYAITTIARYVLAFVGATLAFGAIHIGWDTVKWLAAALTFGLAFGLQEIFANFISGLIILLERPVRVGDTVTVGTVEGVVSRIRMRATTVIDWDNREYIVPNKNLITGEVTNWTLTDSVTRVVFEVGVAYGSDTRKVRTLLMKAATESAFVMKDPPPNVLYRRFGASALEFHLRTYIATRSVWVDTLNDVYTRIDDLFREHGVEMAFPQLDVHLHGAEAALEARQSSS